MHVVQVQLWDVLCGLSLSMAKHKQQAARSSVEAAEPAFESKAQAAPRQISSGMVCRACTLRKHLQLGEPTFMCTTFWACT